MQRERFRYSIHMTLRARHGQLDWEDADHVSSAISLVVRIPALPIDMALPTSRCLICAHMSAFSNVVERYSQNMKSKYTWRTGPDRSHTYSGSSQSDQEFSRKQLLVTATVAFCCHLLQDQRHGELDYVIGSLRRHFKSGR
jgi:hypothetical protein